MRISGFVIAPMSQPEARRISAWRYPPPYDFYDMTAADEDLATWLLPVGDEGRYSAYADSNPEDLAGFFSFGEDTRVPGGDYPPDALDVGLGLNPDRIGRGLGLLFFEAGLEFARRSFAPSKFRLTVAEFNERAMTVYRGAGFETIGAFEQPGKGTSFIQMQRGA